MSTDDRSIESTGGGSAADHRSVPQYEIRVEGHLGSRWAARFEGLSLTDEEGGTTAIRGPVVDQAALHGVLQKLRDVGLPLVSLAQIPVAPNTRGRRPRHPKGTDMTITTRTPMTPMRKATLAAGLFYLATFVFSIPALLFYNGVLNNPDFVHGAGSDGGVLWGAVFEVITALAGIGTAVALYPVIKRHGQAGSIGFVASRTLEAATIFVGVISVLGVYTLRQDFAGTDAVGLTAAAQALIALHDWSFLLGPGVMPAINALCLATVLYRSRLVPRIIPTIGLIGAPILLASSAATLFGHHDQVSSTATLMALPIATWEFSLGVWLTVKGFTTGPTVDDTTVDAPVPALSAAAA